MDNMSLPFILCSMFNAECWMLVKCCCFFGNIVQSERSANRCAHHKSHLIIKTNWNEWKKAKEKEMIAFEWAVSRGQTKKRQTKKVFLFSGMSPNLDKAEPEKNRDTEPIKSLHYYLSFNFQSREISTKTNRRILFALQNSFFSFFFVTGFFPFFLRMYGWTLNTYLYVQQEE